MKLIDLHNHTKFSYDGSDTPEAVIENAIANGIDVIGITDHQFSMHDNLPEYIERLDRCKKRYAGLITVLSGIEIGTRPKPDDLLASMTDKFDYCLFECLDSARGMDLFEFFEWRRLFPCRVGLAHTDIFALTDRYGVDMLREMTERNIFWELNTSGNYSYYYDFLTNPKKRSAAAASGIEMSVGSDTHWLYEYNIGRIKRANSLIHSLGNTLVFSE